MSRPDDPAELESTAELDKSSAATVIDINQNDELVGTKVGGRYLVKRVLGEGGIGKVYLAHDKPEMHFRPVVVKVLLEESLKNRWAVQKFHHEVEALTRLDDSGIVGILDTGQLPDGKPYLVMQYVEGETLRSIMKQGQGMDLTRAAHIIKQIGRALATAHDKGIFHRDLKPENIMIRTNRGEDQIKVIDFGIAKVKDSVLGPSTATGLTAGTYAYMSPEQLHARPVSSPSDVYALGIISYELVTGIRPFNPTSVAQLAKMQEEGVRVNPSDLRPSLPKNAERVILKALQYNEQNRYASAKDFGDELYKALLEEQAPARPRTDPEAPTEPHNPEQPKPRPSRKLIYATIITAILVTSGLVVALKLFRGKPTTEQRNATASDTQQATLPERSLSYSILVQKYRNGKPYQKPFTIPGEINFEKDDRIQLFLTSAQQGYLYLINEGPPERGTETNPMILFPDKDKSALLPAGVRVQIPTPSKNPDEDWIGFDAEEGTEKLWLIWSADAVPELEAVKRWSNPKDLGEIKDSAEGKAVRDFLSRASVSATTVKRNEEGTQTEVTGKGKVLVYSIKLQHH